MTIKINNRNRLLNMLGTVMVNYPINDKSNDNGKSCAYSPIVRDADFNEIDSSIIEMDSSEDIAIAEFNIDDIREYRKRESLGNTYRKTKAYRELLNQ